MKHFLKTLVLLLSAGLLLVGPGKVRAAEKPIPEIDTGGHKAKINDVIFTRDGRYLVSASDDKTVRIWDTKTGETVRVIRGQTGKGPEGKIYAAALSPDNRLLAVGGWMGPAVNYKLSDLGVIRLIDFKTGEVTGWLKGHESVILSLAFSPDGRSLISGSGLGDLTARIWEVSSRKTHAVLRGHTDQIYAAAFSPDGRRAVTGSWDKTLKLWRINDGFLIKTLKGHTDKVHSAAFSPDGRYLLSGSYDKTIRLWEGKTGEFIKVLARQDSGVVSLSISPKGDKVVTGCGYGTKVNNVFAIPSGKRLDSFEKHKNIVLATAVSPDGKIAATGGGDDKEIYLWDINTGQVKQKLVGKGKTVWSVGFSKDGRSIAWGKTWKQENLFSNGHLEQGFQLKEGREFQLSLGKELTGDSGYRRGIPQVGSLSIRTRNGKTDPTLQILKNGQVIYEITRDSTNGNYHRSLTFTPDGRVVVSGGSWGIITSYNPQTGEKIHDFIGHTGDVWGVAASPDSRWLVSGSADQTVRLWEIDSGKLLLTIFQGSDREWVAWTHEGYYTASVRGDDYIGWHINQGEEKEALYYPASRFSDKFYSPEVTAYYIKTGGDLKEAIRLANRERPPRKQLVETRVEDLRRMLPPAVFFKSPSERNLKVKEGFISIRAGANSVNREPVRDIWLLVNGRRVGRKQGAVIKVKRIEGQRAELEIRVPLTQGKNRISVIASNKYARSEPEIIEVFREKKKEDIFKPDLYLLAIGVSEYKDPSLKLDFAHEDARAIDKLFAAQKGGLYKEVHRRRLINKEATRENILEGLDWILRESTQKDTSVIFVAGHGVKDRLGNYYLLPHDVNYVKLRSTGVKWFDFQDIVTALPSRVVFMVDTCHSGSITGKRRKGRGNSDITEAVRELVKTGSGVMIMCASTGREESLELPEWGHGAFTKALLEGLEGKANDNGDKRVETKELDTYVTYRVYKLTNGEQHTTTEIPKTMPAFSLTLVSNY